VSNSLDELFDLVHVFGGGLGGDAVQIHFLGEFEDFAPLGFAFSGIAAAGRDDAIVDGEDVVLGQFGFDLVKLGLGGCGMI